MSLRKANGILSGRGLNLVNLRKNLQRGTKEESNLNVQLVSNLGTCEYVEERGSMITTIFIGRIAEGVVIKSYECEPFWIEIDKIAMDESTVPQYHYRVFEDYKKYRANNTPKP